MDESTEEPQARQAAAISGEIDQEVGENDVLVSGGGADARVIRRPTSAPCARADPTKTHFRFRPMPADLTDRNTEHA